MSDWAQSLKANHDRLLQKSSQVNQTQEGYIPITWPQNYWQRGMIPPASDSCAASNACIDTIAQGGAAMPLIHWRLLDNNGKERIKTSAACRVLRNPNAYQTRSDFILNLIAFLLSKGNAYAYATRNNRFEVQELHLMPSPATRPLVDRETREIFYALGDNELVGTGYEIGEQVTLMVPARDVLHIRVHCPQHPLIGVTPIQWAAMSISINNSINSSQTSFFQNMSRPSGILTTDQVLTKSQMIALRESWSERARGINQGEVPILAGGIKWEPMTITSQDAQLIEIYRMSIEDIARVFRVPLPLIGDYRNATYNNVEQLISQWLSTGLGFMLEHIEAAFDKFFQLPPDQHIEFDVDTLLRTDFAGRINALTKGISGGLYSPDEARAKEGLPQVPNGYGQEPRVQAQVVPLSQVGKTETADSAETAPATGSSSGSSFGSPASAPSSAATEERFIALEQVVASVLETVTKANGSIEQKIETAITRALPPPAEPPKELTSDEIEQKILEYMP